MARTARKVRMVFYLDSEAASRCIHLARKYGATRSEVARVAIENGLDMVVPELRRLQAERADAGELTALDSLNGAPTAPGIDASEQLREYAVTLRRMAGPKDPDELRVLLTAQAKVLRVPVTEIEDVVDEVVSSMPADESPGAGTGASVNPHEPPD